MCNVQPSQMYKIPVDTFYIHIYVITFVMSRNSKLFHFVNNTML